MACLSRCLMSSQVSGLMSPQRISCLPSGSHVSPAGLMSLVSCPPLPSSSPLSPRARACHCHCLATVGITSHGKGGRQMPLCDCRYCQTYVRKQSCETKMNKYEKQVNSNVINTCVTIQMYKVIRQIKLTGDAFRPLFAGVS